MHVSGFPRILAVDDNQQNLSLLKRALTSAHYEVITAEDGPTALKLVGSAEPDLEKLHGSAYRHDHHARSERTLLLIHLRGRKIPIVLGAGRNVLQRYNRVANSAVGEEQQVLRFFLLAANILIDRHGGFLFFNRRSHVADAALREGPAMKHPAARETTTKNILARPAR